MLCHIVGKITAVRAERAEIRVSCDERLLGDLSKIPEKLIRCVRNVPDDTEIVALCDYLATKIGNTRVLFAVIKYTVALSEAVLKPCKTYNTDTYVIKHFKELWRALDAGCTLNSEQCAVLTLGKGTLDIVIALDLDNFVCLARH
jgi:hypothetical protein